MQLLASLIDGILIGFVYGVAAMGLTLIWGVMSVINLSHGPVMALGMFGAYSLFTSLGVNPYLALIAVAIGGLLLGLLIYITAVHRVISAPHLSSLLATFAVNMIIIGIGTAVFSTSPHNIDYSLGSLNLGPIILPTTRLWRPWPRFSLPPSSIFSSISPAPGRRFEPWPIIGLAAELMGIPSAQVLALSFGIGTSLAAVAGGLIATFFPFTILSGGPYELKSFVICVLGGLGNPLGALLGGLLLGGLEGLIPTFMPVSWVPVVEFGLFILVLLVKPSGLLGGKT